MIRFDPSKFGVRQVDQTDCGVACVQSILLFLGYPAPLESVRSLSGKSTTGTTLLGLQDCLATFSINSIGYQATPDNLKSSPLAILHFIQEGLHHFVLFYHYAHNRFEIFDPGMGSIKLTESELSTFWSSGKMLLIEPAIQQNPIPTPRHNHLAAFLMVNRSFLLQTCLTALMVAGAGIALVEFISFILHSLTSNRSTNSTEMVLMLTAILGFKALIQYMHSTHLTTSTFHFQHSLFTKSLTELFALPLADLERKTKGDFMQLFKNSLQLQSNLHKLFGATVMNGLILGTICIYFLLFSPQLGIVILVFSLLIAFIAWVAKTPLVFLQNLVAASQTKNEFEFNNIVEGAITIKHLQKEWQVIDYLTTQFKELQTNQLRLATFKTRFSLSMELIASSLILLTLYIFLQPSNGINFTPAQIVSGFLLSLILAPVSRQLLLCGTQIKETETLLKNFSTLAHTFPIATSHVTLERITKIEVKNLTFRYPGKINFISNLNLTALCGDRILIKGATGSGKTTLFKLLLQYYPPQEGNIVINGTVPLVDIQPELLRKKISFVPQQSKMFNGTIHFNITLDAHIPVTTVEEFIHTHNLNAMLACIPGGLQTYIHEMGTQLTAGQQQLIEMMRALWRKPDVLLLDQCYHSIEPEQLQLLKHTIVNLSDTIVLIATTSNEWDDIATHQIHLNS